jgi:hypothetical protein
MNYLLCAHRLVHGAQDTGGVYARPWPSPADPPRSLPCRSDGIVSSAQRFHCDCQRINGRRKNSCSVAKSARHGR